MGSLIVRVYAGIPQPTTAIVVFVVMREPQANSVLTEPVLLAVQKIRRNVMGPAVTSRPIWTTAVDVGTPVIMVRSVVEAFVRFLAAWALPNAQGSVAT